MKSKLSLAAMLGLMAGMHPNSLPMGSILKAPRPQRAPLSDKFDDDEKSHLELLAQDKTSPGRKAYRQYFKKLKEKYA